MICTVLEIVLKCNIFEFNGDIYKQIQGTAMGTKMAPSYANIFMDDIEQSFLSTQPTRPHLWLRYIDGILCIWPNSNRDELVGFLYRSLKLLPPYVISSHGPSLMPKSISWMSPSTKAPVS